MPKTVSFDLRQDLYDESVRRLTAAGVEDPEALLETALEASAIDALEVIGGDGVIPTALGDVRAARLLEICKLRKELVPDEVVGVLFRVMASTATAISRKMQATYESTLDSSLASHMRTSVKVSIPRKLEGESPSYKLTFSTPAAYTYAVKAIAAARLTTEVSFLGGRAIQFPQQIEIERAGNKRKVKLATETLGLAPDTPGLK